jgi:hypothetical protein
MTAHGAGPYQHGSGFPAVNGDDALLPFPANIPITIQPQATGVQLPKCALADARSRPRTRRS